MRALKLLGIQCLSPAKTLADELKEMVKTAGVDPDEHLEDK